MGVREDIGYGGIDRDVSSRIRAHFSRERSGSFPEDSARRGRIEEARKVMSHMNFRQRSIYRTDLIVHLDSVRGLELGFVDRDYRSMSNSDLRRHAMDVKAKISKEAKRLGV